MAALARLDYQDWGLNGRGEIRNSHGQCPITAGAAAQGAYYPNDKAHDAGRHLGLDAGAAVDIVHAADTRDCGDKRADMLKALGLAETQAYVPDAVLITKATHMTSAGRTTRRF